MFLHQQTVLKPSKSLQIRTFRTTKSVPNNVLWKPRNGIPFYDVKVMVKVVPLSTSLSTEILPPKLLI
jgi:hypothetical protein